MEVRNDISYKPQAYKPSFGVIKTQSAETTLRQVLSLEELEKLKKLIDESKIYANCDLILFGGGKKLCGRIADNVDLKNGKCIDVSPWPWENKYNWIAKMAARMRNRHNEVTELLKKQNFQF